MKKLYMCTIIGSSGRDCVLFYYKIMKKLYMHTIIASSGRDYVLLILFQLFGSKAGGFLNEIFSG